MNLENIWHRNTQTGRTRRLAYNSLDYQSLDYHWLLKRFANTRQDIHLVQGDVNASPDVESVAGTVVKFCNSYSNCHVLALADEDGIVYLFNCLLSGRKALISKWSVHKNCIFDLEWLPFVPRIVTASGHQAACLIDINTQQTIDTFRGHLSSLKTIASRHTDPFVFATGGRDGCICIWDQRVARRGNSIPTSNVIKQAHASGSRLTRKSTSQSITGLCFQDETTLISCASNDSTIKIWDLRRSYKTHKTDPVPKHKITYHGKSLKQVGYSGLVMDSCRTFIYANCIDDCIYQFSGISYLDEVVSTYKGHRNKTFFVKSALSPDGSYLLTGSSDHHARIYQVSASAGRRSRSYQLEGHSEEVTSVAWSHHDTSKIATISDDDTLRIWRLGEMGATDVLDGMCKELSPTSEDNLTRIRSKVSHSSTSYSSRSIGIENTHEEFIASDGDRDVLPWPVLNGLHIQPRVSSPKKLLISPRKSSGYSLMVQTTRGAADVTGVLRSPIGQAKRKLLDCDFLSTPCKRLREHSGGTLSSPVATVCPATLSPIRINNSSHTIINITPTSAAARGCLHADFSSPTANLPNSVLDPQTPRRQGKENSDRLKSVASDWLSQLSKEKIEKQNSSPSVRMSSALMSSAVTPSRSKGKANSAKTPTTSKKVAQTLMKYFSPTSSKSPTTGSCRSPSTGSCRSPSTISDKP